MARPIDQLILKRQVLDRLAQGPAALAQNRLSEQVALAFGPIADVNGQAALGFEPAADLDERLGFARRVGANFSKQVGLTSPLAADLSSQLGLTSRLGADFSKQLGLTSRLGADFSKQLGLTSRLGADFSKQLGLTSRISGDLGKQLGLTSRLSAGLNKELGLTSWVGSDFFALQDSLAGAVGRIRLSPDLQQVMDDLDAAEGFDPAIAILSDQESDTPIDIFAADIAVPTLIGRIERLAHMRSKQRLADAAWRLKQADARWRAAGDEREFPIVIHDAVSALEEVARQIAGRPETTLSRALKALHDDRTITRSQKTRMVQAWNLRNKVPGAGHGAGRAPEETAGFVLFRVRQGLRDLLDSIDVEV